MPTYEFFCQKCEKRFQQTCSLEEYEHEKKKKCPKCGSSKVLRQISSFQVKTSKKS